LSPVIVPIVEGHGEVEAVPLLLRRILGEIFQNREWKVRRPVRAGSVDSFRKRMERYLGLALQGECNAIMEAR